MVTLIFATHNPHKVSEIQQVAGRQVRIVSLDEAGFFDDIPEPFNSLEANAREKARVIYEATGMPCFSEDTGLEVEALNGAPGVKSARYAGEDRNFENNIDKLLGELAPQAGRKARFRTVICLVWEGHYHYFEGICEGEILPERRGQSGFGYDPVFRPEGSTLSFGEMSLEEKNRFSHRRKATDKLMLFLPQLVISANNQ